MLVRVLKHVFGLAAVERKRDGKCHQESSVHRKVRRASGELR